MKTNAQKPDLVLIDDDSLIRLLWETEARTYGHVCTSFSNLQSFLSHHVDTCVPVYVDYCFGEDLLGGRIASELIKKGYQSVYITTGHDSSDIIVPSQVKAVVGKEYPKGDMDFPTALAQLTHDLKSVINISKTILKLIQKGAVSPDLQRDALQELIEREARIEKQLNRLRLFCK